MRWHKVLAPPPTAQIHQPIFSLGTALDTSGQYKWRRRGDFEFPLLTPQFFDFLTRGWGGSGMVKKWSFGRVKSGNSKIATVAPFVLP